ncbi:MAG: tetratricopeptide repeat protein [Candidatus Omnitrophota bacterium]
MSGIRIFLAGVLIFARALTLSPYPAFSAERSPEKEMGEIEREMMEKADYKGAEAKLASLLEGHEENARLKMDMGLALYGLMRYDEAYKFFKQALAKDPGRDLTEQLENLTAKMDENRAVLGLIEKTNGMLAEEPDGAGRDLLINSMAANHIMSVQGMMKDKYFYPSLVIPHIAWLKENMPDMPGLYALSGDVYYSSMMYGRAEKEYEKAIAEDPGNAVLYRKAGDCLVAKGDFDKAGEYYDKAAGVYRKQGVKDGAFEIASLIRLKQALPRAYTDVAELVKGKKFREAEEICRKRISLNPGDYPAITQLGEIYWEMNDRPAAVKLFRKAVKMAPDYPLARFFLGKAYFFERKPEKARAEFDAFREKMELLPDMEEDTSEFYVSAMQYISYMYATLKQYDDVFRESNRILKIKPDDQIAHYNLAVCYYTHYRKLPLAYQELNKVIEIDPGSDLAKSARYYIDFLRRNPDPREVSDFTFVYKE